MKTVVVTSPLSLRALATVALVVCCASGASARNLLTNPSAETGDLTGWTILESGGAGWSAGKDPQSGRLGGGLDGCAMFFTDHEWCRRSQTVDLVAAGYSRAQLDTAPDITFSQWFRGFSTHFNAQALNYFNDFAYLKVELRAADGTTVIASYNPGQFITSNAWVEKSYTFSGYGPGVRYIYWEDGGKGVEQWGSTDGPVLDAAFLGIGLPAPALPEVAVGPQELDFGTFPRSGAWSSPRTVVIENNGTAAMEVGFCICDGMIYDFAFRNAPANTPIPPGGSLSLEVVFAPREVGPRWATLRVYSSDSNHPTTDIELAGIGVPVCTAITRLDPSPTSEQTVRFKAAFSEDVKNVNAGDFQIVQSGVSGSVITDVIDDDANPGNNIGRNWIVTVSVGSGNGTVGLRLIDNGSIVSFLGNYPLGGPGTGTGNFTGGEVYQILQTAFAFYVDANAVSGGNGSAASPFNTIGAAMSHTVAGRGDFVIVRPGRYSELVVLKEGVTLESSRGSFHTHITGGNGNEHVVTAAANTVIRGFTIRNAGSAAAVHVPASAAVTVTNCVLSASGRGLLAAAGAVVVFQNNTVHNNSIYGLRGAPGASFSSVRNNIFSNNAKALSADSNGVTASGYNCFHDNAANYENVAAASTDFLANPLYVAAAANNFHLRAASPCRNAGAPEPAYNNINGSRNDLGADGGPHGVQDTVPPTVVLNASPTSGNAPLTVNFDASESTDEWGIAAYLWDFDAAGGIQIDASGPTAQHTFTQGGTYTVTLTVQDNSGLSAQRTRQISVNVPGNQPPTASANATPRAGAAPFLVQFAGTGSDPDGGAVTFAWDFGNGGTSTQQNPLYTYPSGTARGSYEAVLTVRDNEGASTQASVHLTITQETPAATTAINPAAQTTLTVNDSASAITGARITAPANATAAPIVLALGAVPEGQAPPPPKRAVSRVVEAGPAGVEFGKDLTVRIPLSMSVPNLGEVAAAVFDEQGGYWSTSGLSGLQTVPGTVNYITFKTNRLSFFALYLPSTGADIDRNGVVNAVDVQLVVNAVLGLGLPAWMDADVNGNGNIGAEDVQFVINAALGI